jgi:hypothetical protein
VGRLLNYPDDAHLLEDGQFLTADIRNCRVLIIDPSHQQIATQWGTARQVQAQPPARAGLAQRRHAAGQRRHPGHRDHRCLDLAHHTRRQGVWSVKAPKIRYPSDAFPTVDGKQVIVADFSKPGRVVIFDPATGKPTWEYFHAERRQEPGPPLHRP